MENYPLTLPEVLASLVGFDSSTPEGQAAQLTWIEGWCAQHVPQAQVRRQSVAPEGENLIISLGNPQGGVLIHHDVVPADPTGWTSSPFALQERDGRYYGRGVADNKTHLAAALVALLTATDAALVLTTDEERFLTGVQQFCTQPPDWKWAVVCEPTNNTVVATHPGIAVIEITFTGLAAHASQPEKGDNAIEKAWKYMPQFLEVAKQKAPEALLNVGVIQGGDRANVVPDRCSVKMNFRSTQYSPQDWLADLGSPEGVEFDILLNYPSFSSSIPVEKQQSFCQASGATLVPGVRFYSEAAFMEQAGIPTLLWGVGDIAQAHTVDEWIEVANLTQAHENFVHIFQTNLA